MVQNRILVTPRPGYPTQGIVHLENGPRSCALGRSGMRALKREGDGATPVGIFPLRLLLYRADRVARPLSGLPIHPIQDKDGWSDDPTDRNYNRMIELPSAASAESLKRDDHIYDLVLVLGHNDEPRVRGLGSAIFMHLARPGYTPTEGCVALAKDDFDALLREVGPETRIVIRR